jgi:hypothetical protein
MAIRKASEGLPSTAKATPDTLVAMVEQSEKNAMNEAETKSLTTVPNAQKSAPQGRLSSWKDWSE